MSWGCKMAQNKPTKHIIAYLDFLGTKKRIANEQDNRPLEIIINTFKNISAKINKSNEFSKKYNYLTKIKYRSFSDNILIVISANKTKMLTTDAFDSILELVTKLYLDALQEGILVRGGITIGNIFVNDYTAYGKGLLRAIELEENIAYYPRIILDNNVDKYLNDVYLNSSKFLIDNDFIRYVNILKPFSPNNIDNNILNTIQDKLIQLLEEEQDNLKNLAKIKWLCQYYKSAVDKYNDSYIWADTQKVVLTNEFNENLEGIK